MSSSVGTSVVCSSDFSYSSKTPPRRQRRASTQSAVFCGRSSLPLYSVCRCGVFRPLGASSVWRGRAPWSPVRPSSVRSFRRRSPWRCALRSFLVPTRVGLVPAGSGVSRAPGSDCGSPWSVFRTCGRSQCESSSAVECPCRFAVNPVSGRPFSSRLCRPYGGECSQFLRVIAIPVEEAFEGHVRLSLGQQVVVVGRFDS